MKTVLKPFDNLLYQLHLSYLQARKNKRNTANQLKFEIDHESQLIALAREIYEQRYTPRPSIAFIIHKPVMREIFAADFRDRIVHHLLYRCIYPEIDRKLIFDTYSCRPGKGTLAGIKRAKHFMRSCSRNYQKPTYAMKLDVEAYFMNMRHDIIYSKVEEMLDPRCESYLAIPREMVFYLLHATIFNDVRANSKIKGHKSDWNPLPSSKSLFNKPPGVGLPIGNLTSQVFGNVYLNHLDHYVKKCLNLKYYGRYVDDMLFFHTDRDLLNNSIPFIDKQLGKVGLHLHPLKTSIAPVEKGFLFLGHFIKPHRAYVSNRSKSNFYDKIKRINTLLDQEMVPTFQALKSIRASVNAHLGSMVHAQSFGLRKRSISRLHNRFFVFFTVARDLSKVTINTNNWEWHSLSTCRFTS